MTDDRHLSVNDVYNVITEHLSKLDELWPDTEIHGPRKVHIVELIDAIKLRLSMIAEKNMSRYESPFEKAAKKITGLDKLQQQPGRQPPKAEIAQQKTTMQLAHEAAQARMRKSPS